MISAGNVYFPLTLMNYILLFVMLLYRIILRAFFLSLSDFFSFSYLVYITTRVWHHNSLASNWFISPRFPSFFLSFCFFLLIFFFLSMVVSNSWVQRLKELGKGGNCCACNGINQPWSKHTLSNAFYSSDSQSLLNSKNAASPLNENEAS